MNETHYEPLLHEYRDHQIMITVTSMEGEIKPVFIIRRDKTDILRQPMHGWYASEKEAASAALEAAKQHVDACLQ